MKRAKGDSQPGVYDPNWPFRDMWDAMNKMEKAFFDFYGDTRPVNGRDALIGPSLDLYKEKDNYIIEAALPGIKAGDVDIKATEDSLTISGEVKDERKIDEKDMFWREIKRGSFQRTISFQEPVKPEKVKATFKDGILKITLPIEEVQKSKQIKVEIE